MTTINDIQIPIETRASRLRGAERPAPPAPVDDVAQTLAEYTRLALSTRSRLEIDPVEFTADGDVWVPLWLHAEPPAAARATVRRDGVETVVYRRWVEALPGETVTTDDGRLWRDVWEANPTERFESYVLRAALARAFADVIGDRPEPGKPRARAAAPAPVEPADGEPAPRLSDAEAAELEALVRALPWGVSDAPEVAAMPGPVPRPPAAHVPRLAAPETRGGVR
ncbi:hypothetical protein FHS07_001921 [Microbacterium proteolyticum]|uniref:Uncharacterized protein n=1 Tax=Microbacterium proteolyticum TaxID=1572644 RepID=A0A7W5CIC8_9MICO|nr:hypothetical protein [Microbacterium proteolyticum]MBB3158225.1 hypothetical protein [Microbacterium proteolyticum]